MAAELQAVGEVVAGTVAGVHEEAAVWVEVGRVAEAWVAAAWAAEALVAAVWVVEVLAVQWAVAVWEKWAKAGA